MYKRLLLISLCLFIMISSTAIKGENKYLEFMDREYKVTWDFLYDTDEHLFYRDHRYFPEKVLEANPETSSSAFFCYALAYGVNSGLLDKEMYTPVVINAWQALVSAVHADGKLGWVQPVGQDPKVVTSDMTEVYGVGAFLLAGTEMIMLSQNKH